MEKFIKNFISSVALILISLGAIAQTAQFTADPVCLGQTTTFTNTSDEAGVEPVFYRWNFGDGNISTEKNPSHTYDEAGTYKVELKIIPDGGLGPDVKLITVYKNPDVEIVPNASTSICKGEQIQLSTQTNVDPTQENQYVYWSTGVADSWSVINPPADANLTITVPQANILGVNQLELADTVLSYRVRAIDTNGCFTRKRIDLTVYGLPELEVAAYDPSTGSEVAEPFSFKKGEEIQLEVTETKNISATYEWKPSMYLDNPYVDNPIASPSHETEFTVIATYVEVGNYCVDSLKVTVGVDLPVPEKIKGAYNAFSPNNDGINDYWTIDNNWQLYLNEHNCTLTIYDGWGQEVYTKESVLADWTGWDGRTDDGDDVPEGTYYYLLKENGSDVNIYTGFITLVR